MGCIISYKWLFALIGYNIARGRGFIAGFLFGCLVDYMVGRRTVHFTYRKFTQEDFDQYRQYGPYTQQPQQPYAGTRLQEAYKTLGITEDATDDEVRQAYRRLALRYHPDKVASGSEQEREAAERIFRQIGEAKDIIFKARGMK